jgi:asparagine synthase (glutamine-hydrolysing)
MCGILLHISKENKSFVNSLNDLQKRGPDCQSIEVVNYDGKIITVGHTRLGIIDVNNPDSNQPLVSENNLLTFNGEIYNYKELAKTYFPNKSFCSDSILLFEFLKEYPDKITELKGMFAFCFLDLTKGTCIIVSDPFGKKPIHFTCKNDEFTVASTINAIHYLSPFNKSFFSRKALNYYLKYNYTPIDQTIYNDVKKIPGGSILRLDLNSLNFSIEKYYSPDSIVISDSVKLPGNTDVIYNQLKEAVNRRLIADVNIGIQLSSGVDSTLIACVASREFNVKPEAFTVVYDDPSHSEEKGAKLIADRLGLNHNLIRMTIEDFHTSLSSYYKIYDEPFADPSAIPTIYLNKSVNKKKIRVLLTGDGGDEFWLGYNRYITWPSIEKFFKYRKLLKPIIYILQIKIFQKAILKLPLFRRFDFRQFDIRLNQILKVCNQNNLQSVYESFLAQGNNQLVLKKEYCKEIQQITEKKVTINSMSINDIKNYMQGDILVKNDRASMYYSIETRSPLLDIDLANLALLTEKHTKIDSHQGKKVLRTFLSNLLPEYDELYKKGFGFPIKEWVTEESTYRYIKDKVNNLKSYEIFDENEIDKKVSQFELFPDANIYSIWNLFLLNLFLEENNIYQIVLVD